MTNERRPEHFVLYDPWRSNQLQHLLAPARFVRYRKRPRLSFSSQAPEMELIQRWSCTQFEYAHCNSTLGASGALLTDAASISQGLRSQRAHLGRPHPFIEKSRLETTLPPNRSYLKSVLGDLDTHRPRVYSKFKKRYARFSE